MEGRGYIMGDVARRREIDKKEARNFKHMNRTGAKETNFILGKLISQVPNAKALVTRRDGVKVLT